MNLLGAWLILAVAQATVDLAMSVEDFLAGPVNPLGACK